MKTPSQEDLLGYVLGALDAQEHRDVQQSIDDNPAIEEQLLRIKNSLLPLDFLETSGPRPGLARRTCETVAGWQNEQLIDSTDDQPVSTSVGSFDSTLQLALESEAPVKSTIGLKAVSERILHPRTWSIPDVLVGIASLAILAGILFPAIAETRHRSRIAACQFNLSQVGFALMDYSSANEGQFIAIPHDGNLATIGCIGPILKDGGFITDDSVLSCAGVASDRPVFIPSCAQVKSASCEEQVNYYRRNMLGHFGFTMGYLVDDRYYPPRNMGRSNVVLVADRPSSGLPGRVSTNHSRRGQNLLFEDGRTEFVIGPAYGGDAIYENDYGIVGPGSNATDNVIAPSHLSIVQAKRLLEVIRSTAD